MSAQSSWPHLPQRCFQRVLNLVMPSPVESSSPLQPTCAHIQRRYTGVTGSSRKSIIRPPTLAHRLRSDSRHLAGRVDRRPYAEVGTTGLKEFDRQGSEGSCSLGYAACLTLWHDVDLPDPYEGRDGGINESATIAAHHGAHESTRWYATPCRIASERPPRRLARTRLAFCGPSKAARFQARRTRWVSGGL